MLHAILMPTILDKIDILYVEVPVGDIRRPKASPHQHGLACNQGAATLTEPARVPLLVE